MPLLFDLKAKAGVENPALLRFLLCFIFQNHIYFLTNLGTNLG